MEKTTTLMHHMSTTEGHTTEIEADVEAIDKHLLEIHHDLDYSRKLNESLHTLDTALKTASQLLSVVGIIPAIRTPASVLKKSFDAYEIPVSKAVTASNNVEKIVKPIRERVARIEPKVNKADENLLKAMNLENNFIDILGRAQLCVNSQAPSDIKSALAGKLEEASSNLDPLVLKFDAVQVGFINSIEDVKQKTEQLKCWVVQLIDLNAQINRVMATLSPLIDSLNAIAAAFKQTIRIPYGGYPKMCYEWWGAYPCGWHTVYYSFTIQQILNGVTGAIKPVMDLLDKAMRAVLQPLLNRLNLNITLPEIPGLSILDDLTAHLTASFEGIFSLFEQLELGEPQLLDFLRDLQVALGNLGRIDLTCPNHAIKGKCGPTGCWIPVAAAA